MISVKQARFQSKYQYNLNAMEDGIDKNIKDACAQGEFSCEYQIPYKTPDEVRDRLRSILILSGFKVDIPKYKEIPTGCPSDQMPYLDTITIDWSE